MTPRGAGAHGATPHSANPHVVEFDEVADDRYGGKAAGLAELRRLGLDVPPGFVIADASEDLVVVDLSRWFDRMAAAGATPVAVRSSAAGEDGEDHSFAGQYDTVLGVDSPDAFADAVRTCAASVNSGRASSYRAEPAATATAGTGSDTTAANTATDTAPPPMHLVVQQMVDARAAGVVFTADPTTGRRDLMVIDAVAGLGEALVDGSASPDHLVLDSVGEVAVREYDDDEGVLSPEDIAAIRSGALRAEQHWGRPMDLEWAIDRAGTLWWLQARPITTLPADLGEMDSTLAGPDHVYTRCNIGEMMPGAFCPLTASVSGFAIDYAMQKIQVVARAQPSYEQPWLQVGYFSGHMFLNLTEGTALSSGIVGNSLEQFSTSICGRVVEELVPKPPKPFLRRLSNTIRLSSHALSAGPAIRRLEGQIAGWRVPTSEDPRLVMEQLEAGVEQYCDVTLTHVRSSSRAAVAANILESVLMKQAVKAGRGEDSGRTDAARLMAGASDVESAIMLEQLDAVVRAIAADPPAAEEFLAADPGVAVTTLRASDRAAGEQLRAFLARHGHRGYRELCMRDPSWAEDPEGLGAMMQVMVRSAQAAGDGVRAAGDRGPGPAHPGAGSNADADAGVDEPSSPAIRLLARFAQEGARGREETKAKMALMAHALKRGYRHLGEVLAAAGRLPDADLVFFFDRAELARIVGTGEIGDLIQSAQKRREALAFQDVLEFPDVSAGRPVPLIARPPREAAGGEIIGRPASRGSVEGVVRVARSIVDAREVQPGEILVAPVTDVGWTPYFTVISALVTDIGSSVSHGAVVAREYGLPCVVNTIVATQTLRTGDRVRVDGDRGVVTRLDQD
ncbi:PEP/pyruvate-binding domain-containing protein [Dietzia psychralcaliphila]|uniref:Pyruvate, water dikinase n=3 Tax=Dietzia psychralcaliphila TaxID=139021 RepID=A0AAD0JWA7_9ACTN|nr:PEP/pyruvate-binding domain-containing protein [Dietzia psychralcaliphila]AWH96921.1 pyruvate, water dikinase [Dietzia psychralcaliphila]PTM89583.1 pyruvate,water dikinase [Dietzia psychralcaliphila]